jgi:hypothetical protein
MNAITDAIGGILTVPDTGAAPDPSPGQFWIVSSDDEDRGVVLVSATGRGSFVLAWPVTAATPNGVYPAFVFQLDWQDVMVWPELEFGLSLVALDRMVGPGPDTRTMRQIVAAIEDREPLPIGDLPHADTRDALAEIDKICDQAGEFADLEWPRPVVGEGVLDPDLLRSHDVDATQLRDALAVPPGRAADLASGTTIPTASEVEALTALTHAAPADGVLVPADGPEVVEMSAPRYKARIRGLVARRGLHENAARTAVLHGALQAARQGAGDQRDEVRARIDRAIEDLLASES